MINCWVIPKKIVRSAHRAIHRSVHRVHHHYHTAAVKILAPAVVCVSTGAALAPWLTPPTISPVGQGLSPLAESHAPIPFAASTVPVGEGVFVSGTTGFPFPEMTLPPNAGEIPSELMTVGVEGASLPYAQPEISQSVSEPPSLLLLSTAIGFLAVARTLFGTRPSPSRRDRVGHINQSA